MTTPWVTRSVQPDANDKKLITEPGFGFQIGAHAYDGLRVRLLSREQGVDESAAGARSVLPAVGEVVPGEFDGLELEWPSWYGDKAAPDLPQPVDVLIYKQPIVSAVASPDPRAAMRVTKFLDFNYYLAMGGTLAPGATVVVFDWFDYLKDAGSFEAGPIDRTALGEGSSWMAAEGYFMPLIAATGAAEVAIYAYGALNQSPAARFPWYRQALVSAATYPDTSWSHYLSPYFGSGNHVPFPPNGCYITLKNNGGAPIQWESRLFTRGAR